MSHKITVNILNTVTSKISGTSLTWSYEAIEVWVDGVSTGFTQIGSTLDIPGYTSGVVVVESRLYIISQELGEYGPKDPTNPASDEVFWDSRCMRYPLIATSMKSIETGIIESRVSTFSFMYRGDWAELATLAPSFVNKPINIYKNEALLYSGTSTGSGNSRGVFTVTLASLETALKGECTFGDPSHLVRIDRSTNTSFYNGANIDEKWDGQAIPMMFGPRTPYEDVEAANVQKGQMISISFPLTLPSVYQPARKIGTGFVIKVIPTSATEGILCRTPGYSSLVSSPSNKTISGANFRLFSKTTFSSGSSSVVEGQLVKFYLGNAGQSTQSGRVLTADSSGTQFGLAIEDTGGAINQNYSSFDYNTTSHLCTQSEISEGFTGTLLTSQATSGGNKLWKITVSGTGIDLRDGDYYYVCSSVASPRSAPQVAKYILESHGLSVDSSFDTLGGTLTEFATMQVGSGSNVPTVNETLAEINESLLTLIKKPLGGSTYSIQAIDESAPATVSVTDEEIGAVKVNELSGSTYGAVQYEPKYLRGSRIRDEVYTYQTSTTNNIYETDKVKTINHVLDGTISRFQDITDFWAKPRKNVGFILLDESITIGIGDYIEVTHEDFTGKLMVTSVSPKQLGTAIQGISL